MDTEPIRKLLKEEGNFGPSEEIIERFLSASEEITLRPRERLIDHGTINTNVYCIKEGIMRQRRSRLMAYLSLLGKVRALRNIGGVPRWRSASPTVRVRI